MYTLNFQSRRKCACSVVCRCNALSVIPVIIRTSADLVSMSKQVSKQAASVPPRQRHTWRILYISRARAVHVVNTTNRLVNKARSEHFTGSSHVFTAGEWNTTRQQQCEATEASVGCSVTLQRHLPAVKRLELRLVRLRTTKSSSHGKATGKKHRVGNRSFERNTGSNG